MIKVLVVEDSPSVRELLLYILNSDPEINVIGAVENGKEALRFIEKKQPDVITMDINMPEMDGFEATTIIMGTRPAPIIIVSATWNPGEIKMTFQAMQAGALTCIEKPRGIKAPHFKERSAELIQTVKLMSGVKVVRRWSKTKPSVIPPAPVKDEYPQSDIKVVAVGASTGGPPALQSMLSRFPMDFSASVMVVQHISHGFLPGLMEWLGKSIKLPVRCPVHKEQLLPGHVYFAPDGLHMGLNDENSIALSSEDIENYVRPSVSHLFRSVAKTLGPNAIGILLTGMGKDGAEDLRFMREHGAITFAQDRESSIVYGMPGEAVKLDAAMFVLPPEEIAERVKDMVNKKIQNKTERNSGNRQNHKNRG